MRDVLIKRWVGVDFNPFTSCKSNVYELQKVRVCEIRKKKKYVSCRKAIVSGNVIEIVNYEKPISYGHESFSTGKKKSSEVKRMNNINNAKMNLRRLINSNTGINDKFLTLTYRDNVDDVKACKNDLKRFIKNLKNNVSKDIKYVYVVEFQKRGALHFHILLFDFPYVPVDKLSSWWGFGFVKVNKIEGVDNIGAYVVKYMQKDLIDSRLNGCDLYGRSRGNLLNPVEFTNEKEVDLLAQTYSDKKTYSKGYDSEYYGHITYEQYNLKKLINQK